MSHPGAIAIYYFSKFVHEANSMTIALIESSNQNLCQKW